MGLRVIIESPYSGDMARNEEYARRALAHSLLQGESPVAFHLLYTQVLDDTQPTQRRLGIQASAAFYPVADLVVVYADYGISAGMTEGILLASKYHIPCTVRHIGPNPEALQCL